MASEEELKAVIRLVRVAVVIHSLFIKDPIPQEWVSENKPDDED